MVTEIWRFPLRLSSEVSQLGSSQHSKGYQTYFFMMVIQLALSTT